MIQLILTMVENFNNLLPALEAAHKSNLVIEPILAFWPMLALAAGGALMGQQKQKREQEIEDADRKLQSELTRYSWVDGAQQGNPNAIRRAGDAWSSIGQGALSGAMFGSQFGGSGAGPQGVVGQNEAGGGQLYAGAQPNNTWMQLQKRQSGMGSMPTMFG